MNRHRVRDGLTWVALGFGLAVPFLYYGLQAAAAPFFPSFSVVRTTASELGSDLSQHPSVFNSGIIGLGVVTIVTAVGFLVAFRRLGTYPLLSYLTATAVALNGVQTIWAGVFPLPDPRHGGHPAFVLGMLLLPLLLTLAIWNKSRSRLLKCYFLVTLFLLLGMVPIMSGASGLDTSACRGLVQRVFTLAIFPPISVAAAVLVRRFNETAGSEFVSA